MSDATSDFSDIPTAYPPATGFDSVYIGEVLTLSRNAVEPLEAVPLQQVEEMIGPAGPYLPLIGGTVTGIVDIINNPADPFNRTQPFETHRLMVQIGPNSAFDIGGWYGGTGGPGVQGDYDGIASAISVPADANASASHAIAGYVYTQSPQGGSDGIALLGVAVSDGNNVHTWGSNIVLNDAKQFAPNGLTGQVPNGMEMDVNLFNSGTTFHGIQIHQNFRNPPGSGSAAFQTASGAGFFPLTYSFASFQGTAVNALYVGTTTFAPTTPTPSQNIQFGYVDNTGTPTFHNISMSVQPSVAGGNLLLTGGFAALGISAPGAFVCNGQSEFNVAFHAPFLAGGQNVTSFNSGNSTAVNALSCGATQTTPGVLTNGLFSQKISFGYTETGSATLQNYQLQIAPTATGGTLDLFGSADANLQVKTGLMVGAAAGGMGGVGTVKAQGTVIANGGLITGTATQWTPGTGDPTGVVTAPRGSLFSRTDGGVGTTLYVSQGGTTWNPVAGV